MEADNTKIIALVSAAIEGDRFAFRELYNLFSNSMFNICIRMTADRQDAEDIVQESFIKAFNNFKNLKDKRTFGGWLRTIVVNTCIGHIKNKTDLRQLGHINEFADEDDSEWFKEIDINTLHTAIKQLPAGCRQIFLLYVNEDYSHKEIGKLLNVSESTSKSQYLRAKKILKEKLLNNG